MIQGPKNAYESERQRSSDTVTDVFFSFSSLVPQDLRQTRVSDGWGYVRHASQLGEEKDDR